jgi:hypothetical protein
MHEHAARRLPRQDEVLSSWLFRRLDQLGLERGVFDDALAHRYPEVAGAFLEDPDFPEGRLWRKAMESLTGVPSTELQALGWPSSPWFLMPCCRRSACLICLSEAPFVTAQYVREHWLQSWRTTCSIHQIPLVEMPAVGAAWALLSRTSRKLHGGLMRRPDRHVTHLIEGWKEVPAYLREAVFGAEVQIMNAWHEHFSNENGRLTASGSIAVWRDLLAFCASSWSTMTSPPVAVQALPLAFMTGSTYFRCASISPCAEPDVSLRSFRTMVNPAARRVCLVAVMDAMYEISSKRIVGLKRQPVWGWLRVLPCLPPSAWEWLDRQSRAWPAGWRPLVERWRSAVRA